MYRVKRNGWIKTGIASAVAAILLLNPPLTVLAIGAGDTPLGSIDYVVDSTYYPATTPWDRETNADPYQTSIKDNLRSGQVIQITVDGETLAFQPMALQWTNDYGMIQQVSMPQDVPVEVGTNDVEVPGGINRQGYVRWNDGYGDGVDLQWTDTANVLEKVLEIDDFDSLPAPASYILSGGNPALELNLLFAPSIGMEIYVDGELWDKKTKQQTFGLIDFRKDGEVLWAFEPLLYWDTDGDERQSIATLQSAGQSLYISIRVPYEWLQTAEYPVDIDADVRIEATAFSNMMYYAGRAGPFWTSTTTGYVVYTDTNNDLKYNKTGDGGATWGGTVNIRTGNLISFDCWADWQTAGDAGTTIHLAYIDGDTDDVRYVNVDTSDDSINGDDPIEACQGTGTMKVNLNRSLNSVSITKTRGGNIAVALQYQDDAPVQFYNFYTSPDETTWTSKDDVWEGDRDLLILFPGNEVDNQDIWAAYGDTSDTALSLKTFDDSGNSWSEQAISAGIALSTSYRQMDGQIRLSDGHLILAAWNLYDNANADLMTWDINGAGSITAKTNVITNELDTALISVFINQVNDDIYASYASGTNFTTLVKTFYQLSQDGCGTWDGESALQANVEDDMRWISAGCIKAAWGGFFQPIWFNDDLNDVFTNTDNGVAIAAGGVAAAPTVTTDAADDLEDTTATLNGTITDDGGDGEVDYYGFVWDTVADAGDPGDVDPSGPPGGWEYGWKSADGDWGEIAFDHAITGLPTGTTIHFRACAANADEGWAYGATDSFLTKPAAPINVAATDGTHTDKVVITWAKSTGATDYHVWRDAVDLGASGDVATEDDNGATAGTISDAGTASASDGDYAAHIELSLAGEALGHTSHTYKVVASNATGDSDDSDTNAGYRESGVITYVWWRSNADADAAYASIAGESATTDPYDDVNAPATGAGRWYYCVTSSVGASNTPQESDHNRGFRAAPPTVTTHVSDDIEDTTATGNGEIDAIGGENCTERGFVWSLNTHGDPGNVSPAVSDYENEQHDNGDYGTGVFDKALTGLPTGDEIFVRAYAYNPTGGWDYGYEDSFLTKPAAPTNIVATDNIEAHVTITWTKSTGATDYHVFRGAVDLGASGDVATEDDAGATAGTITNAGAVTATDGNSPLHIELELRWEDTGMTQHSYTVVASNATGDSDASGADNGNRSVGAITHQWQRSVGDADGGYGDIVGATTDPYNDTAAPEGLISNAGTVTSSDGTSTAHVTLSLAGEATTDGAGRYYQCIVSASGASNSPQTSDNNRGYRSVGAITFQWQRSAGDADDGYGDIVGAIADPYNDVAAPAGTVSNAGTAAASDGTSLDHVTLALTGEAATDGAGRYYQCIASAIGASNSPQTSDNNRGYRTVGGITYQWQKSAADADAAYGALGGATTDSYNDTAGAVDPDGRWYYCEVSETGASNNPQDSTHNRGYRSAPIPITPEAGGELLRSSLRIVLAVAIIWKVLWSDEEGGKMLGLVAIGLFTYVMIDYFLISLL